MLKAHSVSQVVICDRCLANRLFVNPLNDGGFVRSCAGCYDLAEPDPDVASGPLVPAVIGFFNQMKQEFVAERLPATPFAPGAFQTGQLAITRSVLVIQT
jgi:hypothetical protein